MDKHRSRRYIWLFTIIVLTGFLGACQQTPQRILRLATTTSTYDSGLLDAILPDFEKRYSARVEVIAVGTGQALELGERGDVDVLLVHDPVKEKAFVEAGHGIERTVLMYNDFIIVGPHQDPAGIRDLASAADAFQKLAELQAEFASRGDQSGTYAREMLIWAEVGLQPDASHRWYLSLGQGMGSTLQFANERGAYTLSDRGTFLAQMGNLPNLEVLVGGVSFFDNPDGALLNCYSVIIVNPEQHPEINFPLAQLFVSWITDTSTKQQIGQVGLERFNQPLFYPVDAEGEKPVPGEARPGS